jgi:DNA-binding protein H-NS
MKTYEQKLEEENQLLEQAIKDAEKENENLFQEIDKLSFTQDDLDKFFLGLSVDGSTTESLCIQELKLQIKPKENAKPSKT